MNDHHKRSPEDDVSPDALERKLSYAIETTLKALPGYPWLNPCPRCGFRGSCDCTVFERARVAHPTLLSLTEVLFKN